MNSIKYNKVIVIPYFIIGFIILILPIILMIVKAAELRMLVPSLVLLIIAGHFFYRISKGILHIIIQKPMIEFSNDEYIDNLNGVKVKWDDVQLISFENSKAPFVIFYLKQDSLFYHQMKNPLKKLFYKFEASFGKSFKTNIRFAKGNNLEIYTEIKNFHQRFKKIK